MNDLSVRDMVDLLQEIGMDEQETRLFLFNSALMQQEEPPPLQHYLESVCLDVFIDKFTSEGCARTRTRMADIQHCCAHRSR